MSDRLAGVEAHYKALGGELDPWEIEWLIAEVKRLRSDHELDVRALNATVAENERLRGEYDRGWSDGYGEKNHVRSQLALAERERDEWKARYEVRDAEVKRLRAQAVVWRINNEGYQIREDKLTDDVKRLRFLIEWVDENASFDTEQWSLWEKLQNSPTPWELADEAS